MLAAVAAVGGPICELPIMAAGCWHYLPSAADYYPLEALGMGAASWAGLSSITGPCYWAVTMDAIALGRWFATDLDGVSAADRRQD